MDHKFYRLLAAVGIVAVPLAGIGGVLWIGFYGPMTLQAMFVLLACAVMIIGLVKFVYNELGRKHHDGI